jgi:hypothetical protein
MKQGWLVYVKGTKDAIECPKCKRDVVVYNGNYFCDSWNPQGHNALVTETVHKQIEGECDWALAHPATTVRDRNVCDLVGIDYF